MDLVKDAAQLAGVERRVRSINAAADIIHTQRSEVDLRHILDRRVYRGDPAPAEEPAEDSNTCSHADGAACGLVEEDEAGGGRNGATPGTSAVAPPQAAHAAANGHARHHEAAQLQHGHTHDSGIRTVSVRERRRLDLERCRPPAAASFCGIDTHY